MIITKEELLKRHPCTTAERVEGFLDCFPAGIVTLAGSLKAARADYDLNWVAKNLLPLMPGRAFRKAIAPARRAYRKATASAEEAYWEATDSARIAYLEAIASVDKAFQEAIAPAFFKAFQEAE